MISEIFLAVCIIGACFTTTAVVCGRKLGPIAILWFFSGWITGELALFHIAWQALAVGVFAALGAFENWRGPVGLGISLASWAGLWFEHRRALRSAEIVDRAQCEVTRDPTDSSGGHPASAVSLLRPFSTRDPRVERIVDVAYGDDPNHRLDIYRDPTATKSGPVLLQIHGGGWVGRWKEYQGLPLMHHLAVRGWTCYAPSYRLSPGHAFPAHLEDVKRALAWIRREGAAVYGGDPSFVAVTGGSAGGHLSSLLALTPGDPRFQPGFEDADTRVAACVPFYGIYDFLERHGARGRMRMRPFLERVVMQASPDADPDAWEAASPISRVNADAPPFFVIHGTHDSLAFVEDAQHFVEALRAVSSHPVVYAELPGAQHAFDIFHTTRSRAAVLAVANFLEYVHRTHQAEREPVLENAAG